VNRLERSPKMVVKKLLFLSEKTLMEGAVAVL
jgi:hypothetical protein